VTDILLGIYDRAQRQADQYSDKEPEYAAAMQGDFYFACMEAEEVFNARIWTREYKEPYANIHLVALPLVAHHCAMRY
jgi:hypothetical protein